MVPKTNSIRLKVAEAVQDDVNKGIVRIDTTFMQKIGVRPGDIVSIEGSRKTVGIADRAYPGDIGLNIIRMDGISRRNSKVGIGELVEIIKADVKEAKKVSIAPARKGIMIRASAEIFKQGLLGRTMIKGDIVALGGSNKRRSSLSHSNFEDIFRILDEDIMGFGFGDLKFIVVDTNPKTPVIITDQTEVVFNPEAVEITEQPTIDITYEDIGGLSTEVEKVREMVELPLKHPEIFERLGIEAPKGVLLHGPPGTGKTLLAKAVANETNSHFSLINGPEIMSKFYGQSEQNLRKKFEEAEKNAPAIIFIDEIDAIAAKREEVHGEVERRVVAQLLALMDGLKSRGKVVVIAATNVPNLLDPALRRPGRFDREIEIGVPSKEGRLDILKIHTRNMPLKGTLDGSILGKKILAKLNDNTLDTTKMYEKIEDSILELKKELKKLEKELEEYDEKSRDSATDKIKGIIYDLLGKKRSIQEKIDQKKLESNELKNKLKKLDNARNTIDENRTFLRTIVKSLIEIDERSSKLDLADRRLNLISNNKKKLTQEVVDLHKTLLDLDILNNSLINEAKREGLEKDLNLIASKTHGFVGADLSSLAKEAAMHVLRKIIPDLTLKEDEPIERETLDQMQIKLDDFMEALKVVGPSALREVLIEVPNIKWDDIGGLENAKQELKEAVEWPLKNPKSFTRLGVKPPKGILLYGSPGTGKTLLAKAVANESDANFILVKGPELLSKYLGDSEKALREIFKKARQASPSIIFFDEIDSMVPTRSANSDSNVTERVVNQLLTEMDGLEELYDIVIIGATNRPDMIDPALLRPGRFDRLILSTAPDRKERLEILKVHTESMPLDNVDLNDLADKTQGYVGADIENLCREAAIGALRENINAKQVNSKHFENALEKVGPSVSIEMEESYKNMKNIFRVSREKALKEAKPVYMG